MILSFASVFVTLSAINIEELVDFYRLIFGQEPDIYLPKVYSEFKVAGCRLGIFKPAPNQEVEFKSGVNSGFSLCLEVASLEQTIAWLTDLGYPPAGEILIASHGKEIYLYDPAGYRLIFYEPNKSNYSVS